MRRSIYTIAIFLFSISVYGQSAQPSTRNALLEVFTGISCGWCPEGDQVSAQLSRLYPQQLFVVDIHAGSYAESGKGTNDYRTTQGDSIHDYYYSLTQGGFGYPCGLINRSNLNGNWAAYRSEWGDLVSEVITQNASVDLQATAQYDGNTRLLTVNVEGRSLAESLTGNQRLGVALTQDGIIGPQNGVYNGDSYVHNHVLRTYLTSAFGDSIGTFSANQTFQRSYSYTVPDYIKEVPVVPENLNVIVFVANQEGEIEQVVGIKPTYINYRETLAGSLSEPDIPIGNRYGYNFFEVKLNNKSAQQLTSATFDVTVNGNTTQQRVDVDIDQFATQQIRVPATLSYADKGRTKYSLVLTKLNDETVDSDTLSGAFNKPKVVGSTITLQMMTDEAASENHFYLKDADGNVVKEFGPFENGIAATYYDTVSVDDGGVYCVEVTDQAGNGLNSGQRGGLITRSATGSLIDQYYQINGYGTRSFFIADDATAIRQLSPISSDSSVSYFTLDGRRVNAPTTPGAYIIRRNQTAKIIIKH